MLKEIVLSALTALIPSATDPPLATNHLINTMAGKFHYAFCCTIKYPHGSRYEKQIDKPNSGDIMNLFMDPRDAKSYISNSQKARILTEKWTAENIYCITIK